MVMTGLCLTISLTVLTRCYSSNRIRVFVLLGDFYRLNDKTLLNYPLTQVVCSPTRCKATLDKIFTNIHEWFQPADIIPNVATSDHHAVLLSPKLYKNEPSSCWRNVTVRSNDSNGKTLLAHALNNFDWSILASIDDIDLKVHYFNQCIMTFLDVFLPTRVVRRRVTDKPWVTDEFCSLIRRRQAAWKRGHPAEYNRLRNKINPHDKAASRTIQQQTSSAPQIEFVS